MNHFSRICVYCGANQGTRPDYLEAATDLGAEMARRGIGLVYGGGSVGMMGAIARAVHGHGGEVHGVIPEALKPKEISGSAIGHLEVVDSMHTRKARMVALADGFIAMPGGFGTFEELFETITWSQLGIHAKPIGLLNVSGYYDPLCQMIDQAIGEGFIRPSYADLLVVSPNPVELLDRMSVHHPPESVVQWVTPRET
ncbi:MAG: TIGR00730 family Rossman fold protein [Caldilineaceae bacterium]|nr:TIGR00730 family Rossman fold protein [Caldilineaceae bacterium]